MGGSRWLRRASAASRYALGACSALMAWVLRARAPVASLIGGCRRPRALRAPAEGEGWLARREDLTAAAPATLGRSAGTVAHGTRAARERRRRRAKVSRRRRVGRAPPAAPWEELARAA